MKQGLRTLLGGIVDYAGMFPPAELALGKAFPQYLDYLTSGDAWMLGRFICPAGRLGEIAAILDKRKKLPMPIPIVALGRSEPSYSGFLEGLSADLQAISAFQERMGERVVVDVFETRLPPESTQSGDPGQLWQLFDIMDEKFADAGQDTLMCFCEPLLGPQWRESLSALAAAVTSRMGTIRIGLKVRCGGPDPESVPEVDQLAFLLRTVVQEGVQLKATAGLHHPFHQFDDTTGASSHGFLNLFVAGVLAHCHSLAAEVLETILLDESADHFQFDAKGLAWTEMRASLDDITSARRRAVVSFGSCSFDEPRDDLRALGWF